MGDIVERLEDTERHPSTLALREEAAQEIRRQRDEIERLRAALNAIADLDGNPYMMDHVHLAKEALGE